MSSSPAADVDASEIRRTSGRVRKQPELLATSSPFANGKRKRSDIPEVDADAAEDENLEVDEESEPSSEGEPDEEEIRATKKRANAHKATANGVRKPAAKKPKQNGTHTLPIRAAGATKTKRQPKKAKALKDVDAEAAGGLYTEIFARGHTLADVAAQWRSEFEEQEAQALADVVNLILKCSGCKSEVTEHDILDPDSVTSKLRDIQEEHQATDPTDYPLIVKGKGGASFKTSITGFFNVFVKTMADSGLVTSNEELMENIATWIGTMSSCADRSFRHTATVVALAITTALCELAFDTAKEATATTMHLETERKKHKFNKARVNALNDKVKEQNQMIQFLEVKIKDWFDAIFVHRYRDIDARIRVDTVEGLGNWIITYPEIFFDSQHLRYMGWVLSDPSPVTRHEALRQLSRLYREKNKLGGLKTFTERFRPRMVEIGISDQDSGVRAAGIELLNLLRENELLEPDDIDSVGRLVFDADQKVRKAVVGFFTESLNDVYGMKIEELGGMESLKEVLPGVNGNHEAPRLAWLKYKCLAEMLQSYDAGDDLPEQIERGRADAAYILNAEGTQSRYSIAAETLYDKIHEIQQWEVLAGYLLSDHYSGRANGVAQGPLSQLKHETVLTEQEETILLEVLNAAVKRSLVDAAEKSVSTKAKLAKEEKEKLHVEREEAAQNLLALIPKLLTKFGEAPNTSAAVLRLEAVLSLPGLQQLRQDSQIWSALLNDVNKQFLSHGSDAVLVPASKAILHAKANDDLDDLTEEKVQALWEDLANALHEQLAGTQISVRGMASCEDLIVTANTLLRILRLAKVSDCVQTLEDENTKATDAEAGVDYTGAVEYIIALMNRAVHTPDSAMSLSAIEEQLEDLVASYAAEAALTYLMWKTRHLELTVTTSTATLLDSDLEILATRRDNFVTTITDALGKRKATDSVSQTFAGALIDLHNAMYSLKQVKPARGVDDTFTVLALEMQGEMPQTVIKVFAAAESQYAKLAGKTLEKPAAAEDEDVGADPMDEDPLSDDEDDQDAASQTQTQSQVSQVKRENKAKDILLAEQRLCSLTSKIVFAILAGVLPNKLRSRLERNKAKLGPNFKDICQYLEGEKTEKQQRVKARAKGMGKGASKAANSAVVAPKGKAAAAMKSAEIVHEDEDDPIEDDGEEDEETLRRRALVIDEELEREELADEPVQSGAGDEESVLGD